MLSRILEILDVLGYQRVVLKSEQKPTIMALKRNLQQRWTKESTLEDTPCYDHRSNGAVERAVRSIQEQVRTMEADPDIKSGLQVGPGVNFFVRLIQWMAEHDSCIIRRFKVGQDGRTAYERTKGRKSNRPFVRSLGSQYGGSHSGPQRGNNILVWTLVPMNAIFLESESNPMRST